MKNVSTSENNEAIIMRLPMHEATTMDGCGDMFKIDVRLLSTVISGRCRLCREVILEHGNW